MSFRVRISRNEKHPIIISKDEKWLGLSAEAWDNLRTVLEFCPHDVFSELGKSDDYTLAFTTSELKGKVYYNIRHWFKDAGDVMKPTRVGLTLNDDEWKQLKKGADEISERLHKKLTFKRKFEDDENDQIIKRRKLSDKNEDSQLVEKELILAPEVSRIKDHKCIRCFDIVENEQDHHSVCRKYFKMVTWFLEHRFGKLVLQSMKNILIKTLSDAQGDLNAQIDEVAFDDFFQLNYDALSVKRVEMEISSTLGFTLSQPTFKSDPANFLVFKNYVRGHIFTLVKKDMFPELKE